MYCKIDLSNCVRNIFYILSKHSKYIPVTTKMIHIRNKTKDQHKSIQININLQGHAARMDLIPRVQFVRVYTLH